MLNFLIKTEDGDEILSLERDKEKDVLQGPFRDQLLEATQVLFFQ